jgi:membrane protein YqaA with SNARE-associated domain
MRAWLDSLLGLLALPSFGLSTLFVIAFVSATLAPIGSEPAVFGLVKLNPKLFWPAITVATAGSTAGGALTWWMGRSVRQAYARLARRRAEAHALRWLERWGPKACLLAWLPVVGDPLCAVAGWLNLPFWPCALYMALGKGARYLAITAALMLSFPA